MGCKVQVSPLTGIPWGFRTARWAGAGTSDGRSLRPAVSNPQPSGRRAQQPPRSRPRQHVPVRGLSRAESLPVRLRGRAAPEAACLPRRLFARSPPGRRQQQQPPLSPAGPGVGSPLPGLPRSGRSAPRLSTLPRAPAGGRENGPNSAAPPAPRRPSQPASQQQPASQPAAGRAAKPGRAAPSWLGLRGLLAGRPPEAPGEPSSAQPPTRGRAVAGRDAALAWRDRRPGGPAWPRWEAGRQAGGRGGGRPGASLAKPSQAAAAASSSSVRSRQAALKPPLVLRRALGQRRRAWAALQRRRGGAPAAPLLAAAAWPPPGEPRARRSAAPLGAGHGGRAGCRCGARPALCWGAPGNARRRWGTKKGRKAAWRPPPLACGKERAWD